MRLLLIENEKSLSDALVKTFEKENFLTDCAHDGEYGLDCALSGIYDAIILDSILPKINGLELLIHLREGNINVPIILIASQAELEEKQQSLSADADDYLTKPFRIPELRARVNAHIRREQRERHSCLNFDRIKIDLSAKTVQVDGETVSLTKSEYMICEFLVRNKGQVFTREQIYEAVFSLDGESDNSTIATHIKNIRAKLNHYDIQPITTAWGIGYKWE